MPINMFIHACVKSTPWQENEHERQKAPHKLLLKALAYNMCVCTCCDLHMVETTERLQPYLCIPVHLSIRRF